MALYTTDLLILGSGPAGYTAGIYAARAGIKVMIVSGNQEGGQLTMTASIENFPGFEDISGYELMDKMKQQAIKLGVQFVNDYIVEVDFSNRPFVCSSENGHSYQARAIIVATGSSAMWLNLESEKKYLGYGVSACATCDGFFYRGRTVAVIGGGNSAVAEALYLATLADKVILVHRRDTLRATKIYHEPIMKAENVELRFNTIVTELLHGDKITGVALKDVVSGKTDKIECEGVFISIGRKPATEFLGQEIELDEGGYVIAGEDTKTSVDGVFAVGDIRTKKLRQIVTAVADGAVAVHCAEEYLLNR
jgi:thioredoxin reductase (NADPH)